MIDTDTGIYPLGIMNACTVFCNNTSNRWSGISVHKWEMFTCWWSYSSSAHQENQHLDSAVAFRKPFFLGGGGAVNMFQFMKRMFVQGEQSITLALLLNWTQPQMLVNTTAIQPVGYASNCVNSFPPIFIQWPHCSVIWPKILLLCSYVSKICIVRCRLLASFM